MTDIEKNTFEIDFNVSSNLCHEDEILYCPHTPSPLWFWVISVYQYISIYFLANVKKALYTRIRRLPELILVRLKMVLCVLCDGVSVYCVMVSVYVV